MPQQTPVYPHPSAENPYLTMEQRAPLQSQMQHFTGEVTPTPFKHGSDTLTVDMLSADMKRSDRIVIPADQPENLALTAFGGTYALAEFELGGDKPPFDQPELPYDRLLVVKVGKGSSPDLQQLAGSGLEQHDFGYLLVATTSDPQPKLKGSAFIAPTETSGIIGREGNLDWSDASGKQRPVENDKKWSPFNDNKSVSRDHLMVTYNKGDLAFLVDSKNAATRVRTRASDAHRSIIKANQKQEVPQVERVGKTAGKRIIRKIIRNAQK